MSTEDKCRSDEYKELHQLFLSQTSLVPWGKVAAAHFKAPSLRLSHIGAVMGARPRAVTGSCQH